MGRLAVDTVCARCLLCCGAWLAIGACASVIARVTRMYVSSRDGMYVCLLCVNGRVTYVCVVCVSPTAKGSRKVGVSCRVRWSASVGADPACLSSHIRRHGYLTYMSERAAPLKEDLCARSPPRDVELQILQKEPPRSYSLTFTNGRLVGAIPNARVCDARSLCSATAS